MESTNTVHDPLLLSPNYAKKRSFCVSLTKLTLRIVMWVVLILWIAVSFLFPAEFTNKLIRKWLELTTTNLFGITGSFMLLFSAPVFVISILSIAYLVISGEDEFSKNKGSRRPRLRLWTFPLVVDGPFGVVSAAEFVGIIVFVAYVVWAVYAYTLRTIHHVSGLPSFEERISKFLGIMGLRFGSIGIYCLAFLFLPVARGSVLLRVIDIPFEHATKYHVWLGHLTMVLFTLHGLLYVVAWAIEGRLLEKVGFNAVSEFTFSFA